MWKNQVRLVSQRNLVWKIINFSSNHPISNKIGLVKGIVDRAIKLSSADNRKKNFKLVKDTLKLNSDPQAFTNNFIKERIHQIYN